MGRALVAAGDFRHPPAGGLGGLGGALDQVVGAVAVHVDLADVGDQARGLQVVHEELRCGHVQRAEDDGAGGGAVAQVVRKDLVGVAGVGEVRVLGLLREGVGVQPVKELQVHAQAAEGVLGRVDVDVAHAGDHELARAVNKGQVGVALRELGEDAGGLAVDADQVAVLGAGDLLGARAVADVPLDDEGLGVGLGIHLGITSPYAGNCDEAWRGRVGHVDAAELADDAQSRQR